jgi:hypothetical protein
MEAKFWSDMVVCWQCNRRVLENCGVRRQEVLDDLQHKRENYGFQEYPLLSRKPLEERVDGTNVDHEASNEENDAEPAFRRDQHCADGVEKWSVNDRDSALQVDVIEEILRQAEANQETMFKGSERPSSVEPVRQEVRDDLQHRNEEYRFHEYPLLSRKPSEERPNGTNVDQEASNAENDAEPAFKRDQHCADGVENWSVNDRDITVPVDVIEDLLRQAEASQETMFNDSERPSSVEPVNRERDARVIQKVETKTE